MIISKAVLLTSSSFNERWLKCEMGNVWESCQRGNRLSHSRPLRSCGGFGSNSWILRPRIRSFSSRLVLDNSITHTYLKWHQRQEDTTQHTSREHAGRTHSYRWRAEHPQVLLQSQFWWGATGARKQSISSKPAFDSQQLWQNRLSASTLSCATLIRGMLKEIICHSSEKCCPSQPFRGPCSSNRDLKGSTKFLVICLDLKYL